MLLSCRHAERILREPLFCGAWRLSTKVVMWLVTFNNPAPNVSGSIGHRDLLLHSRVCSRLRLINKGGVQQQKRGVGFSEPGSLMLRYRC